MSKYLELKERARDKAKEWQYGTTGKNFSWSEIIDAVTYFQKLGRRFGLVREFRENGII